MCRRQPGIGEQSILTTAFTHSVSSNWPSLRKVWWEMVWFFTVLVNSSFFWWHVPALFAIRTWDQKLWFGYAMNAILVLMVVGVLFAVLLVSRRLPMMWRLLKQLLGISDAYYCAECTRLEKDRDGCPKIVNLGASRTDLFYERRRLGAFFLECVKTKAIYHLLGFKKG